MTPRVAISIIALLFPVACAPTFKVDGMSTGKAQRYSGEFTEASGRLGVLKLWKSGSTDVGSKSPDCTGRFMMGKKEPSGVILCDNEGWEAKIERSTTGGYIIGTNASDEKRRLLLHLRKSRQKNE